MTHYRIFDGDGKPVYDYNADDRQLLDLFPEPPHTQEIVIDEPAPGEIYAGSWHVTKLAFRSRFTQAEKVAIEIASLDVPTAPMQLRGLAAALRANQADVATAQYIDLKRADTRAGVQSLETYGLITVGRAAEILDTPPTDVELWK